jgi:hypothetical protein
MDAATARACTAVIKEEHNIADEMSRDVREQLEAGEEAGHGDGAGADGSGPAVATPDKAAA